MKIIDPSYKVLYPYEFSARTGKTILRQIELAARTCYKSENKITDESAEELVKLLIKKGHHAMLEFGPSITIKFICNRGFSHELVRHRIASVDPNSYAQESTRFCNYSQDKFGEEITVIRPIYFQKNTEPYDLWYEAMITAERCYLGLINLGMLPEQARGVLPIDLKTEINIKANIREWRHILNLRTSNVAHPQMRQLMRPLCQEFKKKIPVLFDDINY